MRAVCPESSPCARPRRLHPTYSGRMSEPESVAEPPRARPARDPWRIALPLVLMVTPVVHLAIGAEGGYFWFYLGSLLFLAIYLGAGLVRR